jgi:HD-GYP domain-containing protein (c-di-GMP phosphodiesterase class II)
MLRTFLASGDTPLLRYETPLASAPSLEEIVRTGRPRVVNDLDLFGRGPREHTRAIRDQGYRASYTRLLRQGGAFAGFLFFNSYEQDVFTAEVLDALDVYGHLIGALVASEVQALRTLAAAVRTAYEMVHLRDPETGAHLERMAEFSRLIARDLAAQGKHPFSDADIERIFLFAPLHDLGKIGIPDRVLLKPGVLTPAEREVMKTHSLKGLEMIDRMIANFGLEQVVSVDLLRSVAVHHHEAMDGSGYPKGLKGDDIPIEARIIAVADVFDALSSRRSYKPAWSNEEAFAMVSRLAGTQLDRNCVDALMRNRERVSQIQERFASGA